MDQVKHLIEQYKALGSSCMDINQLIELRIQLLAESYYIGEKVVASKLMASDARTQRKSLEARSYNHHRAEKLTAADSARASEVDSENARIYEAKLEAKHLHYKLTLGVVRDAMDTIAQQISNLKQERQFNQFIDTERQAQ